MPKLAAPTKVDPQTPTGAAVTRARTIAKKAGARPAPKAEAPGYEGEFKGALTEEELASLPGKNGDTPAEDPFDGDGSTAAGPQATKKAVAKKAPARKTAVKKAVAAPPPDEEDDDVFSSSEDFFAPLEDTDDFINVLFYGKEGSTKTTSLATASAVCPDGSLILVVNAEGGLKVKALRKHGVDTSKIRIFPRPGTDDVLDDDSLEAVFLQVQADLIRRPGSWFAVGIDSITDVGQVLVDSAQAARIAALRKRSIDADKNFVDRDDYGVAAKVVRKWLRRFRDLPCHFMVTALERRDVDEDTNKVAYGPAVSPAVANDLMGYVDIAVMLKAADGEKPIRGLTKEGGKYRVKDRFEVLPKVMVEPTFDRIFAYFNGEETEETDPMQAGLPAAPAKKGATLDTEEGAQDTTK